MNEFHKDSVVRFRGFVGVVQSVGANRCYVRFRSIGDNILKSSLEAVDEADLGDNEVLEVAEIRRKCYGDF